MNTTDHFKRGDIISLDMTTNAAYPEGFISIYMRIAWVDVLGIGGTMDARTYIWEPQKIQNRSDHMPIKTQTFIPWSSIAGVDLYMTCAEYDKAWLKSPGNRVDWAEVVAQVQAGKGAAK